MHNELPWSLAPLDLTLPEVVTHLCSAAITGLACQSLIRLWRCFPECWESLELP